MPNTILAITNNILRRLRESVVGTVEQTEQSMSIAIFVADIVSEVAEACDWPQYDHSETIDIVEGTRSYEIPNTNVKSQVRFFEGQPIAFYIRPDQRPVQNDGYRLEFRNYNEYEQYIYTNALTTRGQVYSVTIEPSASWDGMTLYPYPIPDESTDGGQIIVGLNTPQLALDPILDQNTIIKGPIRPIMLGAYALANVEAGQELGEVGSIIEDRYSMALASAIEDAIELRARGRQYDAYPA